MAIRVQKGENPHANVTRASIDELPINDTRLSWKARGLLLYLLSKPNGWEVSVSQLVDQAPDGLTAVRSGIKELIEAGYMVQTIQRQNGRIVAWDYDVYERPHVRTKHEEGGV